MIQAVFDPDRTPGGLWIPDVAKERCDQGIVKYIGPAVKDLKIGDYVLFGGYDGTTIRLEDEGVLILMRESAVKCVIEMEPTMVEGLYYKTKDGEFFEATTESALRLIADTMTGKAISYKNRYIERENPIEDEDDN